AGPNALNITGHKDDNGCFGPEDTATTTKQHITNNSSAVFERVAMKHGATFSLCSTLSTSADPNLLQFVTHFTKLPEQSLPPLHSIFYSSAARPTVQDQQACSPLSYRDALLYALLGAQDPQTSTAEGRDHVAIATTCKTITTQEQTVELHAAAQAFITGQINGSLSRSQKTTATKKVTNTDNGEVVDEDIFDYETQHDAHHITTTDMFTQLTPEYMQECQASNEVEQFIIKQLFAALVDPSTPTSVSSAIYYDLQRYVGHLPVGLRPRQRSQPPSLTAPRKSWLQHLGQLAATGSTTSKDVARTVITNLQNYYTTKAELDQQYVAKLEADKPNFYLQLLKNALAYDLQQERPQNYPQWDQTIVDVLTQLGNQEPLIAALKDYRIKILTLNQSNFEAIYAALDHAEEQCGATTALNNTSLKTQLLACITQSKNIICLAGRPAPPDTSEEAQNNVPNRQLRPYALPAYAYLRQIDAASPRLTAEQQLAKVLIEQFPDLKVQWVHQIQLSLATINTDQTTFLALRTRLQAFVDTTDDKQQITTLKNLKKAIEKLGKQAPEMTIIAAIECMLQTLDDILNAQGARNKVQTLRVHTHFLQQKNALIEKTATSSNVESPSEIVRLQTFALQCQQDESHLLGRPHKELLILVSDFNQLPDADNITADNYDALLLPLNKAWFKAMYPVERLSQYQNALSTINSLFHSRGAVRPQPRKPLLLKASESAKLVEQ
ncbi:MAG: hypothetical protein HN804_09785, partial [Oceanospirillaceae bacterium]|nr:hypothetical protein [Oceanospirillaceae bacterium]